MNLNKVFVIGNLTRDPELRQTPTGQTVCSFGVATNRFFTDSSGQKQKQTEFHNIIAWGRQAEIVNQYLRKGSSVLIEGRLQTRSWQDQQGVKHWKTEIVAERLQLGPRRDADGSSAPQNQSVSQNQEEEKTAKAADDSPPIVELPGDEEEINVKEIPF